MSDDDGNPFDFGPPEVAESTSRFGLENRAVARFYTAFGLFLGVVSPFVGLCFGGWIWCGLATGLGFHLCTTGRRMKARRAHEAMKRDSRPPILLLRAFSDDSTKTRDYGTSSFLWVVGVGAKTTFEETLCNILSPFGPIIAIGRPGETLPPLGAARLWVKHSAWQERIDELLSQCQYVVMIMGSTSGNDGLAWEIRKLYAMHHSEKVIFVVPPVAEEEVKKRWEKYCDLSNGKLPSYQGGELVVTFSQEWRCDVARIRGRRDAKAYRRKIVLWIPEWILDT